MADSASTVFSGDFSGATISADKAKQLQGTSFDKLPPELFEAAREKAATIMKYAIDHDLDLEKTTFGKIAQQVGGTSKVTKDELAAVLLANSELVTSGGMSLTGDDSPPDVTFYNKVGIDLNKNPHHGVQATFEMARVILQNAHPEEVPTGSNVTPEHAKAEAGKTPDFGSR